MRKGWRKGRREGGKVDGFKSGKLKIEKLKFKLRSERTPFLPLFLLSSLSVYSPCDILPLLPPSLPPPLPPRRWGGAKGVLEVAIEEEVESHNEEEEEACPLVPAALSAASAVAVASAVVVPWAEEEELVEEEEEEEEEGGARGSPLASRRVTCVGA